MTLLSVAPAENNHPIRLLKDATYEGKCFPVLYPTGAPTFHDPRKEKIHVLMLMEDSLKTQTIQGSRLTFFTRSTVAPD